MSRRQVADLAAHRREFADAGARIIIIGNGEPGHIPGYADATGFTGPIYTDPEQKTHKAIGFKRGLSTLLGIKSVTSLVGAALAGHMSTAIQGDSKAQGGVLIAGPGDRIDYLYRNSEAGDYPETETLLSKVAELSAA